MAPRIREIVYSETQRPACNVEHDGRWYPGEIRSWRRRPDGWWAEVNFWTDAQRAFLRTVPEGRVERVDVE